MSNTASKFGFGQLKTVWQRGFEARPSALSLAVVELANGGYYVGKYLPSGRHQTLKYFPGNSSTEAHKFAALWNGPEATAAMYPDRV